MKLSVIIVNHNACALLKQAINALITGCNQIDYELIVVDNASTDGSAAMIAVEFPSVHLLENATNAGIAKAANQAIEVSSGEYILMVTPDTKCGKDSLGKMLSFMDEHRDAGGLSIRLLSPQGRFIPESIHGLDNSWAAFFKWFGFAKHLVKTRLYDKARKDWVEEFQVTEVDIVNGACMLLRRSALNTVGLFDERFFMYGHDIDLSYRLRLAGFRNYYFPKTYFFKYDDPQAAPLNWERIRYFYGAMLLFAFKYVLNLPDIKVRPMPQLYPPTYEIEG
jgi:GT2 family glycosyltransferase